MKIVANVMNGKTVLRTITVDYNIPATVADMVKTFGEVVCANAIRKSIVIDRQAVLRRLADPQRKDGRLTDTDVIKRFNETKIGTRTVSRDPAKKMAKLVETGKNLTAGMTKEQKQALAKQLGLM